MLQKVWWGYMGLCCQCPVRLHDRPNPTLPDTRQNVAQNPDESTAAGNANTRYKRPPPGWPGAVPCSWQGTAVHGRSVQDSHGRGYNHMEHMVCMCPVALCPLNIVKRIQASLDVVLFRVKALDPPQHTAGPKLASAREHAGTRAIQPHAVQCCTAQGEVLYQPHAHTSHQYVSGSC
jgi:hypothetical protein